MTDLTREEVLRKIVKDHQWAEVEGSVVDAMTANMLCTVIDALGPENKAKFLDMSIIKMANVGWKLVS